ncbi:MAG: glycosyltransferase family 2 protein [bacterium]|nr:glycosyltransferase family 2 protein [bacterium]
MPDINIVIVNWKMKEDILRCLASLFADIADENIKVIVQVVDNSGNADGIKEALENNYPQVVYINPGGNLGFGKALNLGFKRAAAKFYLPLNPDIEFLAGGRAIKKLLEFMASHPAVGIAAPKLLNLDGTIQESCYRYPRFLDQFARRLGFEVKFKFFKNKVGRYLMRDFGHDRTVPVDWLMGSFMLVRKELTDKIGFFDDRYFMYFEDCDWCRRAWRSGWQVYYIHNIVVKHKHRRESSEQSPILAILKSRVARVHLKSWFKYFLKWGIKNDKFGI